MHARYVVSCLVLLATLPSVALGFDLSAYLEHLQSIQQLTAEQLIQSREPYGPYRYRVDALRADPAYLPQLTDHLALTPDELELLDKHGFVTSERLRYESYGAALLSIWHADLPVFVSTDVVLQALHRSFVDILGTIERFHLRLEMKAALDALHAFWPQLDARHGDTPGLRTCLDDVDVYLTVARSLLAGQSLAPASETNATTVHDLLALIAAEQPAEFPLFNETPRIVDFSQFTVRGHYTQHVDLQRYFRCMMWLGRTELRFTPPGGIASSTDVTREIVDAFLLHESIDEAQVRERLEGVDAILRRLVGDQDNLTVSQLDALAEDLPLSSPADLFEPATRAALEDLLATGDYQPQAINSQILMSNPMAGEPLDPPHAFLLLGQRFVLDSYVFWNVVYDRIVYDGARPFRGLPDPLDVLYVLGNDDVLPLLETELETYNYAPNLSALRYLVDGYDDDFWRQSMYTYWLRAIASLSRSGRQDGAPEFMQTGAWQQEKMNTQLASWAELRHDTLLYAKQSYTGGIVCSYPYTYVEPIPAFYENLRDFAISAAGFFDAMALPGGIGENVRRYFDTMNATMTKLAAIARKELTGEVFSDEERTFLHQVLFETLAGCTEAESGWLRSLYFEDGDWPVSRADRIVADVHTQPTDASGAPVGYVLHVGTGDPTMGVFIAQPPGEAPIAFAGPVASFHQYVTGGFTRLTDEEWSAAYTRAPPPRPDWTYVYLADDEGRLREEGRVLVPLAVDDPPDTPPSPQEGPARIAWLQSAPNPFNPRTVLSFALEGRHGVALEVVVTDLRGRRVKTLFEGRTSTNTYYVAWDGTDDEGRAVASGVYLATVTAGNSRATGKLVLVR